MSGLLEASHGWKALYVRERRLVRRPVVLWSLGPDGRVLPWAASPDGLTPVEVGTGDCVALLHPESRYRDEAGGWDETDDDIDLRARELLGAQAAQSGEEVGNVEPFGD